jgi:hypothetical protein
LGRREYLVKIVIEVVQSVVIQKWWYTSIRVVIDKNEAAIIEPLSLIILISFYHYSLLQKKLEINRVCSTATTLSWIN